MDKILISGGKKLSGTISISGSKNAALPILVATLLTDEECTIENVPMLADIDTTIALLSYIGKRIERKKDKVYVYSDGNLKHTAPYDLVRKMRASVLVMGPLLARLGKVKVSLPGGCAIGARPIDIHLKGFEDLGAEIALRGGYVETKAAKLIGRNISLRFASVGATENLLLATVLAEGRSVIENAAKEPEIVDLADVLNKMGAKVIGAGSSKIVIDGVKKLSGVVHKVIPDRIEAATFLIAAAITKGKVTLRNINSEHIKYIISKLVKSGLKIQFEKESITAEWVKELKPLNVKTGVYPLFPTDVQAQWMALMAVLKGRSNIEESVFENRFLHVCELQRLGADLTIRGNKVFIKGVNKLSGAPVMASDLRAGASLLLAGLAAEGKTMISRVYHLDRGYEHIEKKLLKLGGNIHRIH